MAVYGSGVNYGSGENYGGFFAGLWRMVRKIMPTTWRPASKPTT